MKVSVIIATYNRCKSLKSAIDSVLTNAYPDFDLTIVDQSDNDETKNLVDEYAKFDKRIKYLWSEKGKSKALNLGIKKAKGEIIALTDDDCVMAQDWVEEMALAFGKYRDAGIIFGNVTVPGGINFLKGVNPYYEAKDLWFIGPWSMAGKFLGIGANMAFRREVFEKVWGFDEYLGPGSELGNSEDWDFTYKALKKGVKIFSSSSFSVMHYGLRNSKESLRLLNCYEVNTAAFFYKSFCCGDIAAPWIGLCIAILKTFRRIKIAFRLKPDKTSKILFVFRIIYFYIIYGQYFQYFLGVYKAAQYNVDKEKCLFIPKKRVF